MSLVVNHNMMAAGVARNLNAHYGRLGTSTERLSTGLRVNSAADDAAGLAIRELMRADVASLHQGMRNANDAISMIQTADGALGVIDEKLIRMKELAEQAATGTYDSTQRMMIDSEFQQMASEINRIAHATDFNGIHLLDGSLSGEHNGSELNATGKSKIHFGSGNESSEDYYYVEIGDCSTKGLFGSVHAEVEWKDAVIKGNKHILEVNSHQAGNDVNDYRYWSNGFDIYQLPTGIKNITIESKDSFSEAHKPHVNLFTKDGYHLTGYSPEEIINGESGSTWWNGMVTGQEIIEKVPGTFNSGAVYNSSKKINTVGTTSYGDLNLSLESDQNETMGKWEIIKIDKVTDNLVFIIGGHANTTGHCDFYDLKISYELDDTVDLDISTQDKAQNMLTRVNDAIVKKDKIRANLGALQNRLENSITNINTQAENLQLSESRISDVDVSTQMTDFVRNQILTQSAVAMLAQANSLPQMAMQVIGG